AEAAGGGGDQIADEVPGAAQQGPARRLGGAPEPRQAQGRGAQRGCRRGSAGGSSSCRRAGWRRRRRRDRHVRETMSMYKALALGSVLLAILGHGAPASAQEKGKQRGVITLAE